jgi:hypothetical protein
VEPGSWRAISSRKLLLRIPAVSVAAERRINIEVVLDPATRQQWGADIPWLFKGMIASRQLQSCEPLLPFSFALDLPKLETFVALSSLSAPDQPSVALIADALLPAAAGVAAWGAAGGCDVFV